MQADHNWQAQYEQLQTQILQAHDSHDYLSLIPLYSQAASIAEQHNDIGAARFFLTQAYIFALDNNDAAHSVLLQRINQHDRNSMENEL